MQQAKQPEHSEQLLLPTKKDKTVCEHVYTVSLLYQPCLAEKGYGNYLLWLFILIQWKQSRFYLFQSRGYAIFSQDKMVLSASLLYDVTF